MEKVRHFYFEDDDIGYPIDDKLMGFDSILLFPNNNQRDRPAVVLLVGRLLLSLELNSLLRVVTICLYFCHTSSYDHTIKR